METLKYAFVTGFTLIGLAIIIYGIIIGKGKIRVSCNHRKKIIVKSILNILVCIALIFIFYIREKGIGIYTIIFGASIGISVFEMFTKYGVYKIHYIDKGQIREFIKGSLERYELNYIFEKNYIKVDSTLDMKLYEKESGTTIILKNVKDKVKADFLINDILKQVNSYEINLEDFHKHGKEYIYGGCFVLIWVCLII